MFTTHLLKNLILIFSPYKIQLLTFSKNGWKKIPMTAAIVIEKPYACVVLPKQNSSVNIYQIKSIWALQGKSLLRKKNHFSIFYKIFFFSTCCFTIHKCCVFIICCYLRVCAEFLVDCVGCVVGRHHGRLHLHQHVLFDL